MKRILLFNILLITLLNFGCKREKGCTDPDSLNYDPIAEKDDGSCVYAADAYVGHYATRDSIHLENWITGYIADEIVLDTFYITKVDNTHIHFTNLQNGCAVDVEALGYSFASTMNPCTISLFVGALIGDTLEHRYVINGTYTTYYVFGEAHKIP